MPISSHHFWEGARANSPKSDYSRNGQLTRGAFIINDFMILVKKGCNKHVLCISFSIDLRFPCIYKLCFSFSIDLRSIMAFLITSPPCKSKHSMLRGTCYFYFVMGLFTLQNGVSITNNYYEVFPIGQCGKFRELAQVT